MRAELRRLFPKQFLAMYHGLIAQAAALWYRHPTRHMVVVGITGTSGKTTTCLLLHAILQRAGHPTAMATTAVFAIGEESWVNDTKMSMLGRFRLQRFLRIALAAGCTHAVIETTSEGLAQNRHLGIDYDVAVLTNLTQEHVESHGSFAAYQQAKERLFRILTLTSHKRGTSKSIVVNADDPAAPAFLRHAAERYFTFSLQGKKLERAESVFVENITLSGRGSAFTFRHGAHAQNAQLKLLGRMNIENSAAAGAVAFALGVQSEAIVLGLAHVESVPGRLEFIRHAGVTVIVDYAFHPRAMEELYAVVAELPHRRLIHVLGATGGGRDRSRRPVLGRMAGERASFVVVTNEDPYDEDPYKIMDDVLAGVLEIDGKVLNENVFKIFDRRDAIAKAVNLAKPGDVVLVTGKGNEQAIVVAGGRKIPWDDREVVREILEGKT